MILELLAIVLFIFCFGILSYYFVMFSIGAPYKGTPYEEIKNMIQISEIKQNDKVIDLGCGDSRILIEFAKKGGSCFGYEINPLFYILSVLNISKKKLEKKVKISLGNFWNKSLKDYDIIILFLFFHKMDKLERKILNECKKGTKVISYVWKFKKLKLVRNIGRIYLYIV